MATQTQASRAKAEGRSWIGRSGLGLALLAGAFVSGFAHSGCAQVPAAGVFERYDRDGDGKVTKAELRNAQTFERFDVNRDSVITQAEYKAFLNRAALKQLDKDGDGKISQTEFNALYQDSDHYVRTRQREAQPADGRALPNPLPVKADPLGLRFTQDYVPGLDFGRSRPAVVPPRFVRPRLPDPAVRLPLLLFPVSSEKA